MIRNLLYAKLGWSSSKQGFWSMEWNISTLPPPLNSPSFTLGIDKHQAETRKQPAYQRHKVVHLLKGFQLHEAIGWYGLGQPERNYENSVRQHPRGTGSSLVGFVGKTHISKPCWSLGRTSTSVQLLERQSFKNRRWLNNVAIQYQRWAAGLLANILKTNSTASPREGHVLHIHLQQVQCVFHHFESSLAIHVHSPFQKTISLTSHKQPLNPLNPWSWSVRQCHTREDQNLPQRWLPSNLHILGTPVMKPNGCEITNLSLRRWRSKHGDGWGWRRFHSWCGLDEME